MRLGVVLSPVDNWQAVVEAAQLADDVGLDSLGTDMLDRIRELGACARDFPSGAAMTGHRRQGTVARTRRT